MSYSPLITNLIESLLCMPGIGRKSAQRIAFHLLERDRQGAKILSRALHDAATNIRHCDKCRMFTDSELCNICISNDRDGATVCIVESPADVMAIEDATGYKGMYFILMGHLSPIDGIGPEDLGLNNLENRFNEEDISELIIATNSTVEGDATAHYLSGIAAKYNIKASRIAHGIPLGGELEYVDGGTLSHAFFGRRDME
ncbi:MAG TPA: recombination mediator RecR [Woeseiaceae bacterium]|nr:recombination mediator RecR [Woeseiaceae bacterium]|tara:strand:- start:10303 stop:10902 length:600 start_codon:yes stop_codon:yes gene_type:complete